MLLYCIWNVNMLWVIFLQVTFFSFVIKKLSLTKFNLKEHIFFVHYQSHIVYKNPLLKTLLANIDKINRKIIWTSVIVCKSKKIERERERERIQNVLKECIHTTFVQIL